MKYVHILTAFAGEIWAMQPEKLQAIVDLLVFQAEGGKLSDEEIQSKVFKQEERAVARQDGQIALLPFRGVISNRIAMMNDVSSGGGTSSEAFGKLFQAAVNDDGIKAIIMDVDTPGGATSGTSELSNQIYSARGSKPIIAHVNANAGSAGYWACSGADEIVVTPSGQVGSIGVYGVHDDMSEKLAKDGVKKTLISAGPFKTEGNPFGPLSDEARAAVQQRVDAAYGSFVRDVARNRGVAISAVRDGFGQGRMVDAQDAVSQGMADKVGTLEDTLKRFGASLYAPSLSSTAPAARRAFASARELRALDTSSFE